MKKSKSIQLDIGVFYALCDYFLENKEIDVRPIKEALATKRDAIERHTLYTLSKSKQVDSETREHFRNEYLDKVGIPEEFRWRNKNEND